MRPQFKIGASDRMHLSAEFITNGHWMIKRDIVKIHPDCPRALKQTLNLMPGTYGEGLKNGVTSDRIPELHAVIPDKTGYRRISETAVGVQFGAGDDIVAYKFQTIDVVEEPQVTLGIAPEYVPLMRLGACFAKDVGSPIRICDNDESLIGVIVPVRI